MNLQMNMKKEREGGFTLLELLIVISIIAVLSVALVLVLNPAEALRKSRDAQRISDLSTLKTALGLYLTSTTTPYLGAATAGALNNTLCKPTVTAWTLTTQAISYSLPTAGGNGITDATLDAGSLSIPDSRQAATAAVASLTDGTGWIPVAFDNLTGGSPISNLPVDPTNTIADPANVASTDLVYRYACLASPLAFEIDAQLESTAYTSTDDKRASDGGNNSNYYEVGTNLKVLGTGTDF